MLDYQKIFLLMLSESLYSSSAMIPDSLILVMCFIMLNISYKTPQIINLNTLGQIESRIWEWKSGGGGLPVSSFKFCPSSTSLLFIIEL